ncbi:MAG: tRNA (N6-threonylcarbamoyladenosine(37)-N6)-methyltransferase TrmO [Halanaerobiales bacterium]
MIKINTIGKVNNKFKQPAAPEKMRKYNSEIIVKKEYEKGLEGIEENNYLQVIFYFHLSENYKLYGKRRHGSKRGVFASRSPHRPGQVGVTTVKLITRNDNRLEVKGLDAIDGTPVIDIKPYTSTFDEVNYFEKD